MKTPNKQDWEVAETVLLPTKLFVLWVVKTQLCPHPDDFQRHFGPDFPAKTAVSELEESGFLEKTSGRLALTQLGREALSYLGGEVASRTRVRGTEAAPPFSEVQSRKGAKSSVSGKNSAQNASKNVQDDDAGGWSMPAETVPAMGESHFAGRSAAKWSESELDAKFAELGVNADLEEARVVSRWVKGEILGGEVPDDWEARLPDAMEWGRHIYREFSYHFEANCLGEGCAVEARVRRRLRAFAPHAPETQLSAMVDAVLNRILDKRLHLLDSTYSKYQGSLFAEPRFESDKLPGFFICVADIESRRVPHLPPGAGPLPEDVPDEDQAGDHSGLLAGEEVEHRGFLEEWKRIPGILWEFYSPENGFNEQHRLEAMVSAGFGLSIRDERYEDVVARCLESFELNWPFYEQRLAELGAKASTLFAKLESLREQRRFASDPGEGEQLQERIERLEARLTRLEEKRRQLFNLLQPKPREAKELLGPHVQNLGNTRHSRIRQEVELLERRAREGWDGLWNGYGKAIPADVEQLAGRIQQHIEHPRPSPSEHGLPPDERERRRQDLETWRAEAEEVLQKIRAQINVIHSGAASLPQDLSRNLLWWLADAEDYYQFGVTHQGVLEGIAERRGWRLHHLLRPPDS